MKNIDKNKISLISLHSLYAIIIGTIIGVVGTCLGKSIGLVTELRNQNNWLIYLLPVAGLLIAFLYKLPKYKVDYGTNKVIDTIINNDQGLPFLIAPLIFISTVLTHMFGGSVGRESAAILIGASLADYIARKISFKNSDMRIITMCGMAAGFSALFGTPIAASIFALEIIDSKIINLAIVPVIISSIIAKLVSSLMGIQSESYFISNIPSYNIKTIAYILILAILVAVVSMLMITSLKCFKKLAAKIENPYIKIFVGGSVVACLTLLFGANIYAGGGQNIIAQAIEGSSYDYAFLIKILLTSITLAVGFKGGEIVPTLFVGATFGCIIGPMLHIDAGFASALGMISLFACNTNCPLAAIGLGYELFGIHGLIYFVLISFLSYSLSTRFSLYNNTNKFDIISIVKNRKIK